MDEPDLSSLMEGGLIALVIVIFIPALFTEVSGIDVSVVSYSGPFDLLLEVTPVILAALALYGLAVVMDRLAGGDLV